MNRAGHNSKVKAGPVNAERLKSFADRIDRLEEEKKALSGDVKDVYTEVKSAGYNAKALRKVLADRRRKSDDELDADMEMYRAALGVPGATYRSVAEQLGVTKSKLHRLVPRNQNGTDGGRPHGDSATVAGDETVAPAAPAHDPATGEVIEVLRSTSREGLEATKGPTVSVGTGQGVRTADSPVTHSLEAGAPNPDRDGEASADERDASASSSPPESCGNTEGRVEGALGEGNLGESPVGPREVTGAVEIRRAQAPSSAGIKPGPQDSIWDELEATRRDIEAALIRRSATVQP